MLMSSQFKRAVAAIGVAAAVALAVSHGTRSGARTAVSGLGEADLVIVAPMALRHRPAGEFTRAGKPIDAPMQTVRMRRPLAIMQRQVTAAEYDTCVKEGACPAIPHDGSAADPRRPVVKVSWRDATAYAAWASRKTGQHFRLPTDEEWTFAAGNRFRNNALTQSDPSNPSKRWLALYEAESNRDDARDRSVRPIGAFGTNEHGIADMSGNVWEWTNTCYRRVAIDEAGAEIGEANVNCGVRVVAGRHRSYVTDFVRDPRSGGCAWGVPPSNLGFRLVRDDASRPAFANLISAIRSVLQWRPARVALKHGTWRHA